VQTVRRWIKSGKLKAYKPGREYRILSSDLDEFLEARSSPKARAPLPLDADAEAGPPSLTDIPQDEFLHALSTAVSDEALLEFFRRMDAERTHLELAFRGDEGNRKARGAFARAVQRRMMVFLALVERGIAPPDPEKTRLAEQLQNVLRSSQ
jgi:excisionase family DNA binding protein